MPLPKVAPIIVAALPISDDLTAEELLEYHKKIVFGLLEQGIQVTSYACDGTETERALQRLFLNSADRVIRHVIKNPRAGCPDTVIVIGIFNGHAIVMLQDSKHGLKTFRNNLFSGARLLVLGNYIAIYRHIEELALASGSPLYHRDVHKLDRQDDNAAARLFSGATFDFLAKKYPDYLGELIYLFVFGELIDAYQNRSMPHKERIKLVLQARYFVDHWQYYLRATGYPEIQYLLSREAVDIVSYLVDGLVGLVLIYRDRHNGSQPLLPWLHSTEPCEHVFGEARMVVKDFTMLDFFYMMTKLRIKLREAILRSHTLDFKARASGYCHTYTNNKGIDLNTLSQFPTDDEIQEAAKESMEECESIFALLGIDVSLLRDVATGQMSQPHAQLPSIGSWFLDDEAHTVPDVEDDDDELDEATELQACMDYFEDNDLHLMHSQQQKVTKLSCAAMAIMSDEMGRV